MKSLNFILATIDYAFVDATFFEDGKIPRPMSDVPHSFIEESVTRFKSSAIEEKNKIYFIHLKHTNPARDNDFERRMATEKKGYHFATFGMRFSLE